MGTYSSEEVDSAVAQDPRLSLLREALGACKWDEAAALASAMAEAGQSGDPPGFVLYALGKAEHERGEFIAANHAYNAATKLVQEGSDLQATLWVNRAFNFVCSGGHASARESLDNFFQRRHQYKNLGEHNGLAHQMLGTMAAREGRPAEAVREYHLARNAFIDPQRRAAAGADEAWTHTVVGAKDQAEAVLKSVEQDLRDAGLDMMHCVPRVQVSLWMVRARIEEQRSRFADAMQSVAQAICIGSTDKTTFADPLAQALLLQARCLKAQADTVAAWTVAMSAHSFSRAHSLLAEQNEAQEIILSLSQGGASFHAKDW